MKQLKNGWYVPNDDTRVTGLLENDLLKDKPSYEEKFRTIINASIPNKRTFIDVGANVGIWSLPLTKVFSKVVSYEPSRQNIECIKMNIPSGIELRERAVANFTGEANFHQGGKNCGDGQLSRPGRKFNYTVPVIQLDNENLENVDLIKIDVQGWEYEVLLGAKNLIRTQTPWVLFEVNEDVDKCCELMESLNYEVIQVKSKRMFLWAPLQGSNRPKNTNLFGRHLGPGPYAEKLGMNDIPSKSAG